jgi:hypothetical protein
VNFRCTRCEAEHQMWLKKQADRRVSFNLFNHLYKIQSFFKENRNVILPSWLSSILAIVVLDFYAFFIEIFFPSWVLVCPKHAIWMKKMSLNGLKNRDFTKCHYRSMLNIQTNPGLNIYWDLTTFKGIAAQNYIWAPDVLKRFICA